MSFWGDRCYLTPVRDVDARFVRLDRMPTFVGTDASPDCSLGPKAIDQAMSPDAADCEFDPDLGLAVIKLAEFGRVDKCLAKTT